MSHSNDYYSSGASGLSAELLLGMAKSAQETYEQNFGTPASVEDNGRLFEVDNDGAVTYYEPANPLASIYDVLFGGGLGGYLVGYQGPDVKAGDRVTIIPLKDTKFTWDDPEDDYDPDDYDDYLDDEYGTTIPDTEDVINHPAHYTAYKGIEVIQLTEQMNFNRGNAVKYIARAGLKDPDSEIQDLQKAAWYINREIARLEGN